MTRKSCLLYGCLAPLLLVGLIILAILVADKVIPSRARRALPDSATDIQEYYADAGFNGDFIRILKARLPESDFQRYAVNLALTKYNPSIHGSEYDTIHISIGDVPKWWDEPRNIDNCYFNYIPEKEYITRITWNNGWVYFMALAW